MPTAIVDESCIAFGGWREENKAPHYYNEKASFWNILR